MPNKIKELEGIRDKDDRPDAFLMIGQSNMAGRGDFGEVPEIKNPLCLMQRNGRWQPMSEPINPDRAVFGISLHSGVGLAASFADCYAKYFNRPVGLIPCADGGTSLLQWQPDGLLFDNAVYQTLLAQRTSTVAGVLWHQGESDCADDKHPYLAERLETVLNVFRQRLDLYDVPFLLGGLGDFLKDRIPQNPHYINAPLVNEIMKSVAEKMPMTGFVSAEGLGANADNLHFNSDSLYEFGLRYFKEFEKLRDPNKVFLEKSHPDDALRSELEKL